MEKKVLVVIMALLSLIPIVAAVEWGRPGDIADSLYGLLIYDGNITITFDGDFTVDGGGDNDTDTNESIRFEELIDSDCATTDKMIGVGIDGNVTCILDIDTNTNASSVCSDGEVLLGNGTCYNISGFGVDTDTNLSSGGIVSGNLTIADDYFIFGQPLDGSIGSGVIYASSVDANGNIRLVHTEPLDITYPNMTIRLAYTNNTILYCNITGDTVSVTDNQHSVYYVDSSCTVKSSTFAAYIATDISPGGIADIFNVVAHENDIDVHKGVTVKNKEDIQARKTVLYRGHLGIISGLDITTTTFPEYTQSLGKYQFIRTVVDTTALNSSVNLTELVSYQSGSPSYYNNSGINLTHCDDGSDLVECSTNAYRRYLLFSVGYDNADDDTESHQLAPLDSETYTNIGDCLDIEANPISYTLPALYDYSAVPLKIYCGRRDDSSWTTNFIDLRAGVSGFGATQDTSIFLTKDGTRPLTGDWDTGAYSITMEGELILQAMATAQNITFDTHNLYKIGNSTHWLRELYATNIYNENFYGNYGNFSEINTTDVNSDNMNTTTMEVNENISIGNHVLRKDGNDLAIVLT